LIPTYCVGFHEDTNLKSQNLRNQFQPAGMEFPLKAGLEICRAWQQGETSPADSLDLAIGETGQNQKFQLSQASAAVPEPSSILLLGSGLLPLSRLRRRLLK
jgi:hypothetical protein